MNLLVGFKEGGGLQFLEGPCFPDTVCLPYQDNTYHVSLTWEVPGSVAVHCRHFGRGSQDRVNDSYEGFVRKANLCLVSTGVAQLQKFTPFPCGVVLAAPSDIQKSPVNTYFEDSLGKRITYYEGR